jgi:hypothetical protein
MEEIKPLITMLLEDYKSVLESEVRYENGTVKANAELQLRLVQECLVKIYNNEKN